MSNSEIAVRVEGLGKRYLLPHQGQRKGLDLARSHLAEFLPFLAHEEQDYFWALKDVSFELKRGDIVGILGRNGSGKSTLLKILSGITLPTTGRAELHGRIGSLLEVGTGFHPDLSGRENVFMAGALLGLKQREIRARFDEIVDFAGIEKFIDLPVKRYSSGMYVRLAYAVASMLRSDILILDEVLSVGDASFREKSQKNIESIANDGRTVLFVSHNARAVRSICKSGIVLEAGECVFQGSANDALNKYMQKLHHFDEEIVQVADHVACSDISVAPRLGATNSILRWVSTHKADGTEARRFQTGEPFIVRIGYENSNAPHPYFSVLLQNEFAERVATIHSTHSSEQLSVPASGVIECRIEELRIGEGTYHIMIDHGNYGGSRAQVTSLDCVPNAMSVAVELGGYVAGVGLDSYQGAAHRSTWALREGGK
ncbi:hypothetical protein GCM10011321_33130 [Youhaiella tibetensis]|uniref:ABC transporter ATP-binding protein n=1 Tax=Paradevosia tibetensis TaxID=1447062 RepID=A0A5B9DI53_9HYPH|nr:ABC transporter ATP-binding protein [Youhaiella tibetensis]QEE18743.1 ABC transporter ATP-binding protein [Youhaiella tibetensis]GGF39643.1 hypothetical protein GCM10011321_33130 [Youhaiella tibetensis]